MDGAFTCSTLRGISIAGTCFSMYLSKAGMSMGWRISPAMVLAV
jgi:hypothetical protein